MATAVDRGWPVRELSKADLYLVSTPSPTAAEKAAGVLTVPGFPIRVRKEVGPLFRGLVGDLQRLRAERRLPPLMSAGGYNFRPIRDYEDEWKATHNPRYLSNHSWGFAADLNVPTNPMGSPIRSDFPRAETYALAKKWGLSWGREWSRPDPQHFEFTGTPAEARAAVARITQEDDLANVSDKDLALLVEAAGIIKRAYGTEIETQVPGSDAKPAFLPAYVIDIHRMVYGVHDLVTKLPRAILGEKLFAALTRRNGVNVPEDITVEQALGRAQEASITRQIGEIQ